MDIKVETCTLTLSNEELWIMAYSIKEAIISRLQVHHKYNQKEWKTKEELKLNMCKKLSIILDEPSIYDEIIEESLDIFEAFNNLAKQC